VVSDGRCVWGRTETAGDEPLVLAARAPGVPVLVDRDRARLGWRALGFFDARVLVLDDGFQHHRLQRDVEILTFDARLGLGNRKVLPRGPLREPLRALSRADAIGAIDGALPEADERIVRRLAAGARRFSARRRPSAVRPLAGGAASSPEVLRGQDVGMLAGLAQPRSFRRTLEGLGARVVAERVFRDHHAYARRDLEGLADAAPLWVTTEKDAVKLVPTWVGRAAVVVLAIELVIEDGEALLDWLETRLR
jgi:tetraacyldisaccharide 4'-kinase